MDTTEQQQSSVAAEDTTPVCAGCGNPLTEPFTKTAICSSCRSYFIKYPFPLWIKAFGAGILLMLLISFISLPRNLSTGIHYSRGKAAAESRNYLTAQKEFAEVIKRQPSFIEAKCWLLIAAFYNGDFATFLNTSKELDGKDIDNEQLIGEANNIIEVASTYFPSDSFTFTWVT